MPTASCVTAVMLELANDAQRLLLKTALLASDATHDDETGTVHRRPHRSGAGAAWAKTSAWRRPLTAASIRAWAELAFDSDRKLMSTLHMDGGRAHPVHQGRHGRAAGTVRPCVLTARRAGPKPPRATGRDCAA